LPTGVSRTISSNTESLDLAGKPATAGTYSFTVSVTGCGGHVSEKTYQLAIQTAANHVVDLSWDASTSSGISAYNVYRSRNGTTWHEINSGLVSSNTYSDGTVSDGSTYYYAVTAVNVEGVESSKSESVKAVVP
jgi:fibronectin type 3 domain-containing protein